jgi:glucokinase
VSNDIAIGIDVGGTNVKGALVSRDGKVLARIQRPTEVDAATKSVIGVAESLQQQAIGEELDVVACGIGAAGFIDSRRGAVTFAPNTMYDDPEIAAAVGARMGIPVVVDNDANAAAWGEYRFGFAAGVPHLTFITLGTGIGSGFVVDGRLVRGSTGAAAELGHMVVDPKGPRCPCGLRGCLERFSSGSAIAEAARIELEKGSESSLTTTSSPETVTAEDVAKQAAQYDDLSCSILRRAGEMLGLGLANVVNLFDPTVIVLGGSVVRAGEAYLGPARDELSKRLTSQRRRPTRLDVSSLGNDAGLLGAAALAWDAR